MTVAAFLGARIALSREHGTSRQSTVQTMMRAARPQVASMVPRVSCRFPDSKRIVAIGDLHGDLAATREALSLAELVGANREWMGRDTVLVQVGDVLDRGTEELEVLELLEDLKRKARMEGGDVHMLLGNHELLNLALDFTFVAPQGFSAFDDFSDAKELPDEVQKRLQQLPRFARGRARAMRPGGPIARHLAQCNIAITVGPNVFVHGGLTSRHLFDAGSLESLNHGVQQWVQGEDEREPTWLLRARESPVWMRNYSTKERLPADCEACSELHRTLQLLEAKRMIVGHTPHTSGANSACSGGVWRIDTGMSAAYDGLPEVLEICGDRIRVLTTRGAFAASTRSWYF